MGLPAAASARSQNPPRALGLKKFIWEEYRLKELGDREVRPPRINRWPSIEELEADRREIERKRSTGLIKRSKAKGKRGAGKRRPPDVDLDTLPWSQYKKYSGKRR